MQAKTLEVVKTLLMSLAILPGLVSAGPAQIQYIGTVRDFSQLHNDFEGIAGSDGPQINMLYPYLSSKNQTIFRPPVMRTNAATYVTNTNCYGPYNRTGSSTLANWGQFYWDEHYQDVPGVNIAMPVVLTMVPVNASDPANTLYTMSDQFYHPVNQKGYGLREQLTLYGPPACCESASNPLNLTTNINMWFTVEFSIPFYYYSNQSQVFNFLGDDDLYVFINNRLVCDLGGIHSATACNFQLSSSLTDISGATVPLNAGINQMKIYYAERHTAGSHLQLTTSILPANTAPVVYPTSVSIFKASSGTVVPSVFDADGNPVSVLFYNTAVNGTFTVYNSTTGVTANVNVNKWYDLRTGVFTYAPTGLFVGQEVLNFIATDGMSNSTSSAPLTVNVVNRDLPPVPNAISVNIYSNVISYIPLSATDPDQSSTQGFQYATAAGSACKLGGCTLPCVANIDANGNAISDCLPGYLAPNTTTQGSFLKYVPVNLGQDTIQYLANDGTVWSTSSAPITIGVSCNPTLSTCTSAGDPSGKDPRNSTNDNSTNGGSLAGIIAGAAVAATLVGGALAYVAYYKLAATRFEKAWERDWAQAQISENPMYKSNVKEAFNPLYVESAT